MRTYSEEVTLLTSAIPALAAYDFDGDALDISGNSEDATVTGATLSTDRRGIASRCYLLDWTNDKIACGDIGTNNSVSMWINVVDITATDQIFEGSANDKTILSTAWALSSTGVSQFTDFYVDWVATTTLTAGWHHLVATKATGLAMSAATIGLINASYGNFYVDDVYFFPVTLTATQVLAIYNQQRIFDASVTHTLIKFCKPYLNTDYMNTMFTLSSSGTGTFTIKFVWSFQDTAPDFAASQTNTNRRDYIQVKDYQSGASIDGDTWVAFVADDVRLFEVNSNGFKWVWCVVTSYTWWTVSLRIQQFWNT